MKVCQATSEEVFNRTDEKEDCGGDRLKEAIGNIALS